MMVDTHLINAGCKMPFDPVFTSGWKPKRNKHVVAIESIEMQLGRSDARLGELHCPFEPGGDAEQWKRGFQAEKQSWAPPERSRRKNKS